MVKVSYDDVNFLWVQDHYDLHLIGLCTHEGKVCEFETIEWGEFNEESQEYEPSIVEIRSMNILRKTRMLIKKFLFEKFVGYHWTYKDGHCDRSKAKKHSSNRQNFYYKYKLNKL